MSQTVGFQEFATYLFDMSNPPEPCSIQLNLGGTAEEGEEDKTLTMDFLYNLFITGFKKRFKDIPLHEISEDHFQHVRAYIQALGYDVHLMGFEKNKEGEVTNVKLGFSLLDYASDSAGGSASSS